MSGKVQCPRIPGGASRVRSGELSPGGPTPRMPDAGKRKKDMKRARSCRRRGWVSGALFSFGLLGQLGCAGTALEDSPTATHQALDEREAPAVARINEPIRRLETSNGGRIYMTSNRGDIPGVRQLRPGSVLLSDECSGARVSYRPVREDEYRHGRHEPLDLPNLTLTSHPGDVGEAQQTLPDAAGQPRPYVLPTSSAGWYGLRFRLHHAQPWAHLDDASV